MPAMRYGSLVDVRVRSRAQLQRCSRNRLPSPEEEGYVICDGGIVSNQLSSYKHHEATFRVQGAHVVIVEGIGEDLTDSSWQTIP